MIELQLYSTVNRIGMSKKNIQAIVQVVAKKVSRTGLLSLHCIADTKMTRLNQLYRKKIGTTDVLTFASIEEGMVFPSVKKQQKKEKDYGDIFISIPQIHRQAKQHGISYTEEFTRMLVHGVLHSFGYDHLKKSDEQIMIPLQESLVRSLCK